MATAAKKVQYSIFIDDKGAQNTLRNLLNQKRQINNALKDMKIGSDEYIKATEKYKQIDGQLKEHKANLGAVTQQQKELVTQSGLFSRELAVVNGVFGKTKAAVNLVRLSFVSLKGAIAATGIGLLIIALASLISYFTSTKRGAELLDRVMAGIKATTAVLIDRFSALGETIINAISSPQKAIKDFGNLIQTFVQSRIELVMKSISGFGNALNLLFEGEFKAASQAAGDAFIDLNRGINPTAMIIEGVVDATNALIDSTTSVIEEINAEARAAYELEAAMQRLVDRERELRVEEAETRRDIRAKRLLVEDETLSYEDRLKALTDAVKMEQELNANQLAAARERVRIISEQIALGESMAEDYDRLADAQVDLANKEAASLKLQKTLQAEVNTLMREAASEKEKAAKALEQENQKKEEQRIKDIEARQLLEDEMYMIQLSAMDREIAALMQAYEEKAALAEKYGLDTKVFTEKLENDISAINKKYRDLELKADEEQAKKQMELARWRGEQQRAIVSSGADLLYAFSDLVGRDTVRGAKLARTAALLQIGVDTAKAISSATAASSANPANAVTFGGAGIAQFLSMSATIFANIAQAKKLLSEPLPTYTPTAAPSFAVGGFTGSGFGSPDSSGHKPAGVVHANEYVVPAWMTTSPAYANTLNYLEHARKQGMRGYATGGFVSDSTAPSAGQDMLVNAVIALNQTLQNGLFARYDDYEVRQITKVQTDLNAIQNNATL